MSRGTTRTLLLLLLLVACFSLATALHPRVAAWSGSDSSGNVLKLLLGDARRVFANQAFVQADVYFHSGYYPSVFDESKAPKDSGHLTAQEGSPEEEEHEKQMSFLGPPRDWIEAFGRHFLITQHSHLEGGSERELLPWLKLSAELDPQRVDTYVVAAYWLRREAGKVVEAEQFLREGLRNNPDSYEILFELGRLYHENYHDADRARNVWEAALRRWRQREAGKKDPDNLALEQISINLARLEEQAGHLESAIRYLETAAAVSVHPEALHQQIIELKQKLGR